MTRISALQNLIIDAAEDWPPDERPRLVEELRAIADTLDDDTTDAHLTPQTGPSKNENEAAISRPPRK